VRLAVISDIHEDFPQLKKVIQKAEGLGYDLLACLGDIAGFSLPFYKYKKDRNASACLDLIRQKCQVILPGNHDLHAAGKVPEHSSGFNYPENWYKLSEEEKARKAGLKLWLYQGEQEPNYTPSDLEFIRTLTEYQVLETGDFRILLSHYAYPNLSGMQQGFYSGKRDFRDHFSFMENHDCEFGIIGHGHTRGAYLVSPGLFRHYLFRKRYRFRLPSIAGIPPVTRNGMPSGFCIFDSGQKQFRVHH